MLLGDGSPTRHLRLLTGNDVEVKLIAMETEDNADEEAPIEIKELTKSYGDVKALNGVDIKIKTGEFFGLLGPNGAGKTTTINILTGLVFRDQGSTKVFGKDTIKDFRFTRSKIGIAAQEFSVDWFFPIEKLLYFQAGYYGIKKKDAAPKPESDTASSSDDPLEAKLEKLQRLLEKGLVTEEEAAAKRAKLLEDL